MLQQLSVVAMLSLWARKALGIGCQKRAWLKASNLVFLRSQASHLWHVTYQQYFIKSCHKLVTSFILPDAPKRFSTAAWKPVTLSRKKVWQVLSVLFVRQPHVLSIFLLICSFPPSTQLKYVFWCVSMERTRTADMWGSALSDGQRQKPDGSGDFLLLHQHHHQCHFHLLFADVSPA